MLDQPSFHALPFSHAGGLPSTAVAIAGESPASAMLAWRASAVGLGCLALLTVFVLLLLRLLPAGVAPKGSESTVVVAEDFFPETGTEIVAAAAMPPVNPQDAATDETAEAFAGFAMPRAPEAVEMSLRLERGQTMGRLLRELGLAATDVGAAVGALSAHVALRSLAAGQSFDLVLRRSGGRQVLQSLSIRPEARREIVVERAATGGYFALSKMHEVVSHLHRAAGEIQGSLIASAEAAGVPRQALAEMLKAFSWDVNFQHDLREGDRFELLTKRQWTVDGWPVDGGRLLWAELTTGGGARRFAVYRFKPEGGESFFYNEQGESVVKALLRTPLNMSRMTSRFGMRRHPVLRFTRFHAGVDFAAPAGTPILAAGAGRVLEAGRNRGYGNWVKIGHQGGLATGYAHMSRIAPGVRRSARVRQGQVIGYVGSTGLSTGPHLHFELHRDGKPVDPQGMARITRSRLSGVELRRFRASVTEIDQQRRPSIGME